MSSNARLVLASASPRRLQLVKWLGLEPTVQPADVDETAITEAADGESPEGVALRLASAKADIVASADPTAIVIAADTVVALDGRIFGKPADGRDAWEMLAALRGRPHSVSTGLCLARGDTRLSSVTTTTVTMRAYSGLAVTRYIDTREPVDKAGAYAVQGLGRNLVERVDGCYTNVVGLAICSLVASLNDLGLATAGEPVETCAQCACHIQGTRPSPVHVSPHPKDYAQLIDSAAR